MSDSIESKSFLFHSYFSRSSTINALITIIVLLDSFLHTCHSRMYCIEYNVFKQNGLIQCILLYRLLFSLNSLSWIFFLWWSIDLPPCNCLWEATGMRSQSFPARLNFFSCFAVLNSSLRIFGLYLLLRMIVKFWVFIIKETETIILYKKYLRNNFYN